MTDAFFGDNFAEMVRNNNSAATKQDLESLEDRIRTANKQDLESFESRIVRHFDVAIETIRYDLTGANNDEVTSLKNRVTRIESHFGLKPL